MLQALDSLIRRAVRPRARPGRALVVVDFHDHTRGGHFGPWLRWFVGQFSTRFDDVHVLTPRPSSTRSLFGGDAGAPANVSFHWLPRWRRREFAPEALALVAGVRRERVAVFVQWGYDLVDLRRPSAPSSIPWATLAGISWWRRGHERTGGREHKLVELFESSPACRAFLQPDAYLVDAPAKAIALPDVEDVSRPAHPTPRAERIRAHGAGRFCLGAFGILTGLRCLDELLRLAQAQPDVRFVLAGKIAVESVAPELRPLLADGALPNVLAIPGFIPTEAELNDAIAATDGVFIDGRSYPVQSGIVCKAVHFGRCIVSPRSNSWTADFIRERGVGFVYDARSDGLADAWTRWKADGGEARSRAASAAVRDPVAVAACFDRVSNELVKGLEPSTT